MRTDLTHSTATAALADREEGLWAEHQILRAELDQVRGDLRNLAQLVDRLTNVVLGLLPNDSFKDE
jgi:hypothetical protein